VISCRSPLRAPAPEVILEDFLEQLEPALLGPLDGASALICTASEEGSHDPPG